MIDPSKATPQAPRSLRVGSKGFARAQIARMRGTAEPPPAADDDEDEDEGEKEPESSDRDGAMAAHEETRAAAAEAHTKAAEALEACKGSDSASGLLHAEEMGDDAGEKHEAFKTSSMKLRGAAPEEQPPAAAPQPAAPGARLHVVSLARAIAATGGDAAGQTKIAACVAHCDKMLALFGAPSLDDLEGLVRAAHQDAADAVGLRAAAKAAAKMAEKRARLDADVALRAELASAVRAGKYTRAELFDVAEANGTEVLTPHGWLREMPAAARAAMIAKKQARGGPGSPRLVPDETPLNISAAVRAYGEARGYSEAQIAKLAETMPANPGAPAPSQETA